MPTPPTMHPSIPAKPELHEAEPDVVVVRLGVVVRGEVVVVTAAAVVVVETLEETAIVVIRDVEVVAGDTYAAVVVTAGITELVVVDAETYTADVVVNVDVAGEPGPLTTKQRVRTLRLIGLTER